MDSPADFPQFDIRGVWLDSAYYHPMSIGTRKALDAYLDFRSGRAVSPPATTADMQVRVREKFARLIGANADEVAFVPSATVGENLLVAALRLGPGSRVLTDELHYRGSMPIYQGLRDQGCDVEVLRSRDGRILLEDIAVALGTPTDLVAVSAVSHVNGFVHDLPKVCELAHARGALVYADIIQVAGALPFDVRASAVDFCGTSTYKWLMGDQGLGFLYVREDRLSGLHPTQHGLRQESDSPAPVSRAGRVFEVGSISLGIVAALDYSLGAILKSTPLAFERHRAPLLARLRAEMPAHGFKTITPAESNGPLLAFATDRATDLIGPLNGAGIFVTVSPSVVRIAPSMFNTDADIDRLMEVLRVH